MLQASEDAKLNRAVSTSSVASRPASSSNLPSNSSAVRSTPSAAAPAAASPSASGKSATGGGIGGTGGEVPRWMGCVGKDEPLMWLSTKQVPQDLDEKERAALEHFNKLQGMQNETKTLLVCIL